MEEERHGGNRERKGRKELGRGERRGRESETRIAGLSVRAWVRGL